MLDLIACPACGECEERPVNLDGSHYICTNCGTRIIDLEDPIENPEPEDEPFIITCPSCGCSSEAPESLKGEWVKCLECKKHFQVPIEYSESDSYLALVGLVFAVVVVVAGLLIVGLI